MGCLGDGAIRMHRRGPWRQCCSGCMCGSGPCGVISRRRCIAGGGTPGVMLRQAVRLNSLTELALTKLDILDQLDSIIDGDRTVNVVGGFAGWFAHPNVAPKRWKQAALVLLALYPTSLVLGVIRDALYPDLAGAVAILIGNAIGVAVLSWILMPALTRAFDGWLRR